MKQFILFACLVFTIGCNNTGNDLNEKELKVLTAILGEFESSSPGENEKWKMLIHPSLVNMNLSEDIKKYFGEYEIMDEIIKSLKKEQQNKVINPSFFQKDAIHEIIPRPFPNRLPELPSKDTLYLMFSQVGFDKSENFALVLLHLGMASLNAWNTIYFLKRDENNDYIIIDKKTISIS